MHRYSISDNDTAEEPNLAATVTTLADQVSAITNLNALIALVADKDGCQRRAEELKALIDQAAVAKAENEARSRELDERKAALDRYQDRVDDKAVELYAKQCDNERTQVLLLDISDGIRVKGDQLKREILRYAGITRLGIQDLPDWDAMAKEVFGQPDPHFDTEVPEGQAEEPAGFHNDQAIGVPDGSTLTRRRSMRRVAADGATAA